MDHACLSDARGTCKEKSRCVGCPGWEPGGDVLDGVFVTDDVVDGSGSILIDEECFFMADLFCLKGNTADGDAASCGFLVSPGFGDGSSIVAGRTEL